MKCRSSSDDLGCYEFSGGFSCDLEEGHEGPHRCEVGGWTGHSATYRVEWEPLPKVS